MMHKTLKAIPAKSSFSLNSSANSFFCSMPFTYEVELGAKGQLSMTDGANPSASAWARTGLS